MVRDEEAAAAEKVLAEIREMLVGKEADDDDCGPVERESEKE